MGGRTTYQSDRVAIVAVQYTTDVRHHFGRKAAVIKLAAQLRERALLQLRAGGVSPFEDWHDAATAHLLHSPQRSRPPPLVSPSLPFLNERRLLQIARRQIRPLAPKVEPRDLGRREAPLENLPVLRLVPVHAGKGEVPLRCEVDEERDAREVSAFARRNAERKEFLPCGQHEVGCSGGDVVNGAEDVHGRSLWLRDNVQVGRQIREMDGRREDGERAGRERKEVVRDGRIVEMGEWAGGFCPNPLSQAYIRY